MKFDLTIDARMIKHSGIGTYLKSMISILAENYNLTLLGNTAALSGFPWSEAVKITEAVSPIYSVSEQFELPGKISRSHLFISPHYNIPLKKIDSSKRAVIIHDVNHLANVNKLSLIRRMYAKYMINSAIRKSDSVFTISEFSKNEIIRYADSAGKDIRIIYFGLNGNEFSKNSEPAEKIKQKYNLPENYLFFIGSIKRHKNIDIVIRAFNEFVKSFPEIKLVVAGITSDQLEKKIVILNSTGLRNDISIINYAGDKELPALYSNALCLVFPSFYEGFGLPPLEAMICGCPVIASNAASIPEVCGDAALYFNPFNAEGLVNLLKQIAGNKQLRYDLITKGYENAGRFSRERFAGRLKEEIDKTILS